MRNSGLFAAALSQVLGHELTECRREGRHADDLLDRLLCEPDLDAETRWLCEEKVRRLTAKELRP
jgi:hypothetical protein